MNASTPAFPSATTGPAARSVRSMMVWVLIALIPGIAARALVPGPHVLRQIAFALSFALLIEALLLYLRRQSLQRFLFDGSASVTAVLLALCLPPTVPWWIIAFGMFAALLFGKHLYGGLGRNPFNPAMLGVALLLVCFPGTLAMTSIAGHVPDDHAWIWIPGLDALGGVLLIWLRIVRWQTPLAVLVGAAVCAAVLGFAGGVMTWHALLADNLVLAAFFIASDPVTGCVTPCGRWVFGLGVGLLIVLLQHFGESAGSLPFAVLLMNCAAPWIDARTQPRRLVEQEHG
jgi:electron transport complex protein RnfD